MSFPVQPPMEGYNCSQMHSYTGKKSILVSLSLLSSPIKYTKTQIRQLTTSSVQVPLNPPLLDVITFKTAAKSLFIFC